MPFDATSAVGETNPQSSTDQMDKILNAVIANSLNLTRKWKLPFIHYRSLWSN